MPLVGAGQPELIRSNQKDVFYLRCLRDDVSEICRDFFGATRWLKWRKEIELVSDLWYFGLTTVCGFQTLGEEYCNIVQVDNTRKTIPTVIERSCLVLLHIFGPYLLEKLLQRLENHLKSSQETTRDKQFWLGVVSIIRQGVTILHRVHLALFYMRGVFYHAAKRVVGIQYLLVRSHLRDISARPSYRLLGWLSMIQLLITTGQLLYHVLQGSNEFISREGSDVSEEQRAAQSSISDLMSTQKCTLCLEKLTDITTTPCGHLFCWYCIAEWCNTKAECPLCREKFQISRLVRLWQFVPT